jgi:hypothetical protein
MKWEEIQEHVTDCRKSVHIPDFLSVRRGEEMGMPHCENI